MTERNEDFKMRWYVYKRKEKTEVSIWKESVFVCKNLEAQLVSLLLGSGGAYRSTACTKRFSGPYSERQIAASMMTPLHAIFDQCKSLWGKVRTVMSTVLNQHKVQVKMYIKHSINGSYLWWNKIMSCKLIYFRDRNLAL